MKILAMDLASETGVAIGHADAAPVCLTERLGEPGDPHQSRFSYALNMMNLLIKKHRPDMVAIEQAIASGPVGGQSRVQLAMGFRACVMGVCKMRNTGVREFHVSTVRKHFIGNGGLGGEAAKKAVMQRCKVLGWSIANHNEGDACAVWDYARYVLTRHSTLPPTDLFDHGSSSERSQAHGARSSGATT